MGRAAPLRGRVFAGVVWCVGACAAPPVVAVPAPAPLVALPVELEGDWLLKPDAGHARQLDVLRLAASEPVADEAAIDAARLSLDEAALVRAVTNARRLNPEDDRADRLARDLARVAAARLRFDGDVVLLDLGDGGSSARWTVTGRDGPEVRVETRGGTGAVERATLRVRGDDILELRADGEARVLVFERAGGRSAQ